MLWVPKGRNLYEVYNDDGRFPCAFIVDFKKVFAHGASVSLVIIKKYKKKFFKTFQYQHLNIKTY